MKISYKFILIQFRDTALMMHRNTPYQSHRICTDQVAAQLWEDTHLLDVQEMPRRTRHRSSRGRGDRRNAEMRRETVRRRKAQEVKDKASLEKVCIALLIKSTNLCNYLDPLGLLLEYQLVFPTLRY